MFYRRKLILALMQLFGDKLGKIDLFKLLFFTCSGQTSPDYEFVPYRYGCYSFSARADLKTMTKKELIIEDENGFRKNDPIDYLQLLKADDQKLVHQTYHRFHWMSTDDLTRYSYIQFPYYAINSTVAERLLNPEQLEKVRSARPEFHECVLFTLGYQGISLEAYLNKLISQGIQSAFRQQLHTQADYDRLFDEYKVRTLEATSSAQERIMGLLKEKRRIALTCFEANICQCHRKHLAEAITRLPGWNAQLIHI